MHRGAGVHDDFLRVPAPGQQRHGPIAHRPAVYVRTDLRHHAGAFQPEDRRGARRRRIATRGLQQIGAIHRRRAHGDAQVICAEYRTFGLADLETGVGDQDCAHGCSLRVLESRA